MKKLLCMILSVAIILVCALPASSAQNTIVIDSFTVDDSGLYEFIGHLSGNEVGAEVAFVMQTAKSYEESQGFSTSNIIYLDQVTTGNNGTFLISFRIPERFSGVDSVIRIGSSADTENFVYEYTIPELYIDFNNIENNSVVYGNDAYTIDSQYLTGKYVAQSIINGGNVIFFKLGNKWYDLLNEAATSSAYLVSNNAENDSSVKKYCTGLYYRGTEKIQLKGA